MSETQEMRRVAPRQIDRMTRREAQKSASSVEDYLNDAAPKLTREHHHDVSDVKDLAARNTSYRRVIDTTPQMQQVVMHITPRDGGIERETHLYSTQYIHVLYGTCVVIVNGRQLKLSTGISITIPANSDHEILNQSDDVLLLHTIYAPPVHAPDLVQRSRYTEAEEKANQLAMDQKVLYWEEEVQKLTGEWPERPALRGDNDIKEYIRKLRLILI